MSNIFHKVDIMTKALNASWKRNEIISNNIANVNTPNFKKSHVEFETLLRQYLDGNSISGKITNEKHIPIGMKDLDSLNYKITTSKDYKTRRDGNNVDIDVEMGELAKNAILFNTLSSTISSSFTKLKTVIKEGR